MAKLNVKVGQKVFITGRPRYKPGPSVGWFVVEKVGRLWITCDGDRYSILDGKAETGSYFGTINQLHLSPEVYLRDRWASQCLGLLKEKLSEYGPDPFTPEQLSAALLALGVTPPEPPTLKNLKK